MSIMDKKGLYFFLFLSFHNLSIAVSMCLSSKSVNIQFCLETFLYSFDLNLTNQLPRVMPTAFRCTPRPPNVSCVFSYCFSIFRFNNKKKHTDSIVKLDYCFIHCSCITNGYTHTACIDFLILFIMSFVFRRAT